MTGEKQSVNLSTNCETFEFLVAVFDSCRWKHYLASNCRVFVTQRHSIPQTLNPVFDLTEVGITCTSMHKKDKDYCSYEKCI